MSRIGYEVTIFFVVVSFVVSGCAAKARFERTYTKIDTGLHILDLESNVNNLGGCEYIVFRAVVGDGETLQTNHDACSIQDLSSNGMLSCGDGANSENAEESYEGDDGYFALICKEGVLDNERGVDIFACGEPCDNEDDFDRYIASSRGYLPLADLLIGLGLTALFLVFVAPLNRES